MSDDPFQPVFKDEEATADRSEVTALVGSSRSARHGETESQPIGPIIALAGGALVVAGSFLPWVTGTVAFAGTVSANGLEGGGDGVFTLIAGVAIILAAVVALVAKRPQVGVLIGLLALAAAGVLGASMGEITSRVDAANNEFGNFGVAKVGMGVAVLFVGAAIALVGAFVTGMAVKPKEVVAPARTDERRCPYCDEVIQPNAIVCRYCGRDL